MGDPVLRYVPVTRHTFTSDVNVNEAAEFGGRHHARQQRDRKHQDANQGRGRQTPRTAIPKVSIIKDSSYAKTTTKPIRRSMSISKRSWPTS